MARILVHCAAVGIALVVTGAIAPEARAQTGDPEAGARSWDAMCDNCHGPDAQGAFGPDLAGGRGLTLDQFRRAIRRPWGVMPTLNEEQLSDQGVADVYAFVGTKPPVPQPGEWHWRRAPETAPVGQRLYMNTAGCGQCHEPENAYGRMWLGEHAKEVDVDYFARQIYEHTDKYPRGRMGTYRRERLPEAVLREIYEWMVIDVVWKFPHMAAGEAPHCVARRIGQAPSPPQLAYFLLPGTSRNRRYRGNCADLHCGGKGGYEDRRGMTGCR